MFGQWRLGRRVAHFISWYLCKLTVNWYLSFKWTQHTYWDSIYALVIWSYSKEVKHATLVVILEMCQCGLADQFVCSSTSFEWVWCPYSKARWPSCIPHPVGSAHLFELMVLCVSITTTTTTTTIIITIIIIIILLSYWSISCDRHDSRCVRSRSWIPVHGMPRFCAPWR